MQIIPFPPPEAIAAREGSGGSRSSDADVSAEAVAHAVLRLVGDMPAQMGRLRVARVVGGYPVPVEDDLQAARLAPYAIEVSWPLKETVELVDAMIAGGLMAKSVGTRPTLVLTRAGHRALDALESGRGLG